MPSEAERIAAALTEAQRRAVLRAKPTPWGHAMPRGASRGMWEFGILSRGLDAIFLNELGLEVRKILQENADAK